MIVIWPYGGTGGPHGAGVRAKEESVIQFTVIICYLFTFNVYTRSHDAAV